MVIRNIYKSQESSFWLDAAGLSNIGNCWLIKKRGGSSGRTAFSYVEYRKYECSSKFKIQTMGSTLTRKLSGLLCLIVLMRPWTTMLLRSLLRATVNVISTLFGVLLGLHHTAELHQLLGQSNTNLTSQAPDRVGVFRTVERGTRQH